ncbi:hypothetical protein SAMN05421688_1282 [Poseidonocella pacifica]|uniref:Invasion protein IalB, involved in pathogenesis n=1 Tax=Poseidonocella pacifica TaxID=871651 RepID=A0A1I0WCZ0_9RHOB|nr:invasion associated locus B family protein [Poseidonocella pacifica]SFA86444.1 hypothetical protein SAMN05421688_1282 [Poseidonocella pacifica]
MMSRVAGAVVAATIGLQASIAGAQQSDNQVAAKTDWAVFMEETPKACWSVSAPEKTVNTRNGNVVSVSRGDILLFVFYRPEAGAEGQVTFTGGYPFADGSNVTVDIGGTKFEMFTQNIRDKGGELVGWAWPTSPAEDAKMVAAMKRGAEAVLTARSSRGTQTQDTFSLLGFTAALEEAQGRCK